MTKHHTPENMQELVDLLQAPNCSQYESRMDEAVDILRYIADTDSKDREDAERYRWMRDNVQPFLNENERPHVIINVCVGAKGEGIGWFNLIDITAHVGVVTLDQAIDAARKASQ